MNEVEGEDVGGGDEGELVLLFGLLQPVVDVPIEDMEFLFVG